MRGSPDPAPHGHNYSLHLRSLRDNPRDTLIGLKGRAPIAQDEVLGRCDEINGSPERARSVACGATAERALTGLSPTLSVTDPGLRTEALRLSVLALGYRSAPLWGEKAVR